MIEAIVLRSRSYRRFYQDVPIESKVLKELVNLARLSPSAANIQPLKYIISHDQEKNSRIFPHLSWAGYLQDWSGPEEGEKPSAYIIILGDKDITKGFGCDHGIAAQSILLGAVEKGLGGCMIGYIERDALRKSLNIPRHYEILLCLALGKPKGKALVEEVGENGDIRYWRDKEGVHHVPKRSLDDIIIDV